LPRTSVERTHPFGKIVFEEHPGAARLGPGQLAHLGAAAHFLVVHVQEFGGFVQVEGTHVDFSISMNTADGKGRGAMAQRPR